MLSAVACDSSSIAHLCRNRQAITRQKVKLRQAIRCRWNRVASTVLGLFLFLIPGSIAAQTVVGIRGSQFTLNGEPTYSAAQGFPAANPLIEGTLLNVRAVQAVFDDANYPGHGSKTHPYFSPALGPVAFDYPDGPFSAERNVREFLAALPEWRRAGVLAFTVNLQGGGPVDGNFGLRGEPQPQANSAFDSHGRLKTAYGERLRRVIAEADRLHMVVIVGFFYFGSEENVGEAPDDAYAREAIREASSFLKNLPHRNILIEIANEISLKGYRHPLLKADRIVEAVRLAQKSVDREIPVSFSWTGPLPAEGDPAGAAFRAADYLMFHTNGQTPEQVTEAIGRMRARFGNDRPVLINEDGVSTFNLCAAVENHVGWGFYDQGLNDYRDGFQSPPVNWQINTLPKWIFFEQVARLTGSPAPPSPAVTGDNIATIRIVGLEKGATVRDVSAVRAQIVARDAKWPVKRIEFFVDGRPYSYCRAASCPLGSPMPWGTNLQEGKHTLRVVAYFRRGPAFSETAEMTEVPFTLKQ